MTSTTATLRCAALILAAAVLAHGGALTDHFVGYNAQRSLVDNPDIRSIWPLDRALGLHLAGEAARADGGTFVRRPVLSLSFALGYALHGPDAWGFQAGNLLIHALAALLLFGLVRRTLCAPRLRERWARDSTLLATAVAVLWVVHPLTTESVAYVIQRAESLAALFALATLYATSRFRAQPERPMWAAVAVLCCVLGMATKESVAALPLLVWLYDAAFFTGSLRQSLRQRSGLLAGLAVTWIVPALLAARTLADVQVDFRPGRSLDYLAAQPRVLAEYLRLCFWPHPLHLYTNTTRFTDVAPLPTLLFGSALVAALLGTAAAVWRARPAGFPAAAFFLLLAPSSSVIATNDVIQEHRMHLPLAAVVCGVLLVAFATLQRRSGDTRRMRVGFLAGVAAAALVLATTTQARNADYASDFAAFYPGDLSMAHGALARHAAASGRFAEAAERYATILTLPDSAFGDGPAERRYHRGRAHNDFAAVLVELGRTDDARTHVEAALATGIPLAAAVNNAAVLDALAGRAERALTRLQQLEPPPEQLPWKLHNLGVVASLTGDLDLARSALDATLAAQPRFELARRSREAVGKPATLRVHLLRNYDDAWLFLYRMPAAGTP